MGQLQLALVLRLAGQVGSLPLSAVEQVFAVILAIVNGVSLIFNVMDSWRWLRGDRVIPGQGV